MMEIGDKVMEIQTQWQGGTKFSEGYVRCLHKAIERVHQLLIREAEPVDHDRIHAVKSMLYAAIERAGLESERLLGVQRMLRELFVLIQQQADPCQEDREQAQRILNRLSSFERHEYKTL